MTRRHVRRPGRSLARRPRPRTAATRLRCLALSGIALLLVAGGVAAPLLAPYAPDAVDILAADQGSSSAHWLGTDVLGRDNLSPAALRRPAQPARAGHGDLSQATAVGTAVALLSTWAAAGSTG